MTKSRNTGSVYPTHHGESSSGRFRNDAVRLLNIRSLLCFVVLIAPLLCVLTASKLPVRVSANVQPLYRDGVVLMAFHRDVPKTQQRMILSSVGAREIKQIGVGVHVLEVGRGRVFKVIQALKAHREVRYAEPDYLQAVAAGPSPNDTNLGLQWALQNTGQTVNGVTGTAGADERAEAAWGVSTGTNSVVVVILDTGVQYSHPDLAVNMWNNPGGIGGCPAGTHGYNVVSSNCDPMDDDTAYNGHGTHIAGIIGAVTNNAAGVAGVNWTTSIMAVKWLTSNDSGNTSNLISAMDWVIQAKQAGANVRVANDSVTFVGTAFSQALSDEIDLFGSNDILFVTAAGNTSQNNDSVARYPCSYHRPNMICVAASDQNDHLWSSSNYGPTTVDLAAPGVNIYSTLRLSNYGYISGTSMSAGEVSGTAALVLSRGNQTVSNLKSDILNNVDTLASLNGFVSTSGRLDVCKAVPGCSSAVTGSPVNSSLPVITAIAQFGSLLGASTGSWSGVPTNYTYQWFRCDSNGSNCVPIVGANSQTYVLLADADVGATLRVTVTASNGSGSSSAQSAASAVVTQASSPFGINSSILDGNTIGGSLQWQASPSPSVNFVQFFIDGVLSQTYSSSPYAYNRGTTNALDTTALSNGTHVLGIRALSTDNITYGFYGATVVVSNSFSITTTSLANGTQNTAYSATLMATGGTTPYAWSIGAGSLPAGLTLNSATGAITGTPTGTGTSNFTVKVTDANSQTAAQALSITISSSGGGGSGGISVLQARNANQSGVSSLTVNIATTAGSTIICGVSEGDNATDTWTMTDSAGQLGWTQDASGYLTADTTQRVDMRYITNSAALSFVRVNYSTPITYPATMVCYEVSGIATVAAEEASASATSPGGGLVSGALTTANANDILIYMERKGGDQTSWTAGSGYVFAASATNARMAMQYKVVSASQTSTMTSMTPNPDTGSSSVGIFAAFKSSGSPPSPTITTTSLTNGTQNMAYSATLGATGGTAPYTWSISAGSLAAGLTLNTSTGAITGTPTGTGTSNFTAKVTDANSQTATQALSITINSAGGGISVLQAQNANLTGVTSLTVNIATRSGSALICGVREGDNKTDTWTMTDSAAQTGWVQVSSGYVSPNTTNRADMRYITNSAALTWVRATFSSRVSKGATMVCYEVSGLANVSTEDASVNSTSSGGGLVSGPLTTLNANDILIYMEGKGADQTSWAAGPGYLFPANAANARVAIQFKIVSTPQTNTTTSITPSPDTNGSSGGIFAAFK